MKQEYYVIGQMSGTSLDGLDIAYCRFEISETNQWLYEIIKAETFDYNSLWKERFKNAENLSALDFIKLDTELGEYVGEKINTFISNFKGEIPIDFISLHGHTVFHQPSLKFTTQICNANIVAAVTKQNVVYDFRSLDVALNGQGAPLVPIGDELLFGKYDYCINLGGFANISLQKHAKRLAYDICPLNIVLNELSNKLGLAYDNDGNMAREGNIIVEMLDKLNNLEYYSFIPPKSLGKEWVIANINPIITAFSNYSTKDLLRTYLEHSAFQIAKSICNEKEKTVFFTGGGTFNSFLIERIAYYSENQIIIPDSNIINFKEALIFAFLGVKRWKKEVNCLKSVTGADIDNIGGSIILNKI